VVDVASLQQLKRTIAPKNSNCVAWHDRGGIPKPCKRVKMHQKKDQLIAAAATQANKDQKTKTTINLCGLAPPK